MKEEKKQSFISFWESKKRYRQKILILRYREICSNDLDTGTYIVEVTILTMSNFQKVLVIAHCLLGNLKNVPLILNNERHM